MKTRKALTAAMLAAFVLSITPAAFAQSGTTSGSAPAPRLPGAPARPRFPHLRPPVHPVAGRPPARQFFQLPPRLDARHRVTYRSWTKAGLASAGSPGRTSRPPRSATPDTAVPRILVHSRRSRPAVPPLPRAADRR